MHYVVLASLLIHSCLQYYYRLQKLNWSVGMTYNGVTFIPV